MKLNQENQIIFLRQTNNQLGLSTPQKVMMYDTHSLDLLLQCCIEQLDEQVLLSVVLGVVEHGQNDVLHEPVCLVLRHFKDQLGKVDRVSLKEIEEMLVGLEE